MAWPALRPQFLWVYLPSHCEVNLPGAQMHRGCVVPSSTVTAPITSHDSTTMHAHACADQHVTQSRFSPGLRIHFRLPGRYLGLQVGVGDELVLFEGRSVEGVQGIRQQYPAAACPDTGLMVPHTPFPP